MEYMNYVWKALGCFAIDQFLTLIFDSVMNPSVDVMLTYVDKTVNIICPSQPTSGRRQSSPGAHREPGNDYQQSCPTSGLTEDRLQWWSPRDVFALKRFYKSKQACRHLSNVDKSAA